VTLVYGGGKTRFTAARDIAFTIGDGETFALVGESGSGKSTIARAVSGLLPPTSGSIRLAGEPLAGRIEKRTSEQRRLIQYVFQNPDASLNPRARIGAIIARPLEMFFSLGPKDVRKRVDAVLDAVRLDPGYTQRYPDQLSGGERQRVAIARALVAEPALLLCDEILSALDVSVQASILDLLQRLKRERGISMLFISHDLAVVRMLADQIGVLYRGEFMEIGSREQVFSPPFHPYTYSLLLAVPSPWKRRSTTGLSRRITDAAGSSAGCVFAGRCPWQVGRICETERPPWRRGDDGLAIRCHLSLGELAARAEWPPKPVKLAEPAAQEMPQ
jgi:peptide/nickel transport system ATP-binding protein